MSVRRILVATDGSPGVSSAVEHAIDLATALGGQLTALFVVDDSSFAFLPAPAQFANVYAALRQEGERALKAAHEAGAARGIEVATVLRDGRPDQVIVETARAYDLVVVGKLGHQGLAHLLLGSVAERVVRHADCPVLVVPPRSA
jgi:nucleotide-binding universal stress UspA family protein